MTDIFRDSTRQVPTQDPQIVRVDMEQQDIGGRKSHLPPKQTAPDMAITHVPNPGGSR